MEERKSEVIVDDVMLPLPGFRFHPTDEELVGFYLRRKIQHLPLSIELIRQLDIYKYDPWDLPELAMSGEKEWYFYCQRDRKYRNSARPNRVTGAGFWKATGTDRPIYSANTIKTIIGLKKSLVFYKGRASKGFKTDWMMHEFRLPDSTNIPPNDSWAICRIFKKTNISAAQRAAASSLPKSQIIYRTNMLEDNDENGSDLSSKTTTDVHLSSNLPSNFPNSYDPFDYLEGKLPQLSIPNEPFGPPPSLTYEPMEVSDIAKSAMDVSSILSNISSSLLGDFDSSPAAESSDPLTSFPSNGKSENFSLPTTLLHQMQGYDQENALLLEHSNPWESESESIGYPLSCIWDKLLN